MNNKRKKWFKAYKGLISIFKKPTNFVYLGDKIQSPSVILSNHVGTKAPLSFELYLDVNARFWGAYQMNSGFKKAYGYQTKTYYHEKKGWNIHLARLFCLLATPLTRLFYKGLNLISTYPDLRLKKTFNESLEAVKNNQSIIIFPEDSKDGYHDELKGFHGGFLAFLNYAYKRGFDLPIYLTYYHTKSNTHMIDEKVMFSKLIENGESYNEIAQSLCNRCNELGKLCEEKYQNNINNN